MTQQIRLQFTAELIDRDVVLELNSGKKTKEVAEKYNLKISKVNDINRGKSSGEATADLRTE